LDDGDSDWAGTAGKRVGRLSDEAAGDNDLRVVDTGSVTGDRVGGSHDVVGRRKYRIERRIDAGRFPTIVGMKPGGTSLRTPSRRDCLRFTSLPARQPRRRRRRQRRQRTQSVTSVQV